MTAVFALGLLELLFLIVTLLIAGVIVLGGSLASWAVSGPWILGVCSGLATRRGVPVVAVRLLAILLTMLTGVVPGVVVYLLLGLFLDNWIGVVPLAAGVDLPQAPVASGSHEPASLDRIGRYRITGVLGRGGMGTVYLGRDDALQRQAAVKVLHPRLAAGAGPSASVIERFAEEARSIARLTSPHVVQIYEFEPKATPPFLAMEYVNGPSLQQVLKEGRRFSPEAAADCGRQVLAGLASAHAAGIVHRDVKPANILRAADGIYKLTDFGLARSLERAESLTMTGTLLGTVSYLAPEVAAGDEATATSDLYSLGVTLYQSLAGRTPFGEASPLKLLRQIAVEDPPPLARFRDDVPPAFEAWLMKLLARDAADRFASATAALAALEAIGLARPAADAVAAGAAVSPAVMPLREADRWIPRADVDSILRTAMRMEADGESLVGERSVLEIARELDVDEAFVRKTLDAYQQFTPERRHGRQRGSGLREGRGRVVVVLIAAVVAILFTLFVGGVTWFRFASQEKEKAVLRRQQAEAALEEMKVTLPVPRDAPNSRASRDAEIILLEGAGDGR